VGGVGGQHGDVCPLAQGLPNDVVEDPGAVAALEDLDLIDLDRLALPKPAGAHDAVDLIGHVADGVTERGPPRRPRLTLGLVCDIHGVSPEDPSDHPQEAQEKVRRS